MSWEAVETVGDEAAAAVLLEALAAAEIPAELRRLPGSPYGPVKLEIEVRVDGADAARARAILAQLSEEAEAAARAEAHLPVTTALPPSKEPKVSARSIAPELAQTLYMLAATVAVLLATLWLLRYCGSTSRHVWELGR